MNKRTILFVAEDNLLLCLEIGIRRSLPLALNYYPFIISKKCRKSSLIFNILLLMYFCFWTNVYTNTAYCNSTYVTFPLLILLYQRKLALGKIECVWISNFFYYWWRYYWTSITEYVNVMTLKKTQNMAIFLCVWIYFDALFLLHIFSYKNINTANCERTLSNCYQRASLKSYIT